MPPNIIFEKGLEKGNGDSIGKFMPMAPMPGVVGVVGGAGHPLFSPLAAVIGVFMGVTEGTKHGVGEHEEEELCPTGTGAAAAADVPAAAAAAVGALPNGA
jgi:hypothetical protein